MSLYRTCESPREEGSAAQENITQYETIDHAHIHILPPQTLQPPIHLHGAQHRVISWMARAESWGSGVEEWDGKEEGREENGRNGNGGREEEPTRTQHNSKHIILDCVCLRLVERQQDERLVVVHARVGEQGEEPVFQGGHGEVDGGVVQLKRRWGQGKGREGGRRKRCETHHVQRNEHPLRQCPIDNINGPLDGSAKTWVEAAAERRTEDATNRTGMPLVISRSRLVTSLGSCRAVNRRMLAWCRATVAAVATAKHDAGRMRAAQRWSHRRRGLSGSGYVPRSPADVAEMWRIKIDIIRPPLRIVANNSNTLDAVDDNELTSAGDNDGTHDSIEKGAGSETTPKTSVRATCNGVPRFEDDGGTKEEAREFVDCASQRQERERRAVEPYGEGTHMCKSMSTAERGKS
ncbi:hypothetical protein B0H10DRAFT_1970006 [Mycena sp. CBHHK59/15]|nr:hypothetical protein B0H10DRAFT_1970006 [Mycena sp. CBHHK59/15]